MPLLKKPALGLTQRLLVSALWLVALWFQVLLVYITRLDVFLAVLPLLLLVSRGGWLGWLARGVVGFYGLLMLLWTGLLLWGFAPWHFCAALLVVALVWAVGRWPRAWWRWSLLFIAVGLNTWQRQVPALGVLEVLALAFLWKKIKHHWLKGHSPPRLACLGAAVGVLALGRFVPFYITGDPGRAPLVNEQPGVRVFLAHGAHPTLGESPRLFAEHCDGRRYWLGTLGLPMLSLHPKPGVNGGVKRLEQWGRPTDLMWEDCALGRVVTGNFRTHSFLLLDNQTLRELWRQDNVGGRPSYMAVDPRHRRVFFGEDIGDTTWTVDYGPAAATLTRHPLPAVDLLFYRGQLYGALHGALARVNPRTMRVRDQVFLPVFIQPQLTVDPATDRLYVSDIILGRVWVYHLPSLTPLGSAAVGPGVRYVYYDTAHHALYTLNYMNGWLTAWDTRHWRVLGRRWVGERSRAVNESRDGREILFASRVGLVAVRRGFWKQAAGGSRPKIKPDTGRQEPVSKVVKKPTK